MTDKEWTTLIVRFGHQIRRLRGLAGLSQDELARRARTSQGTISRLESGKHDGLPFLSVVKVIAALGVVAASIEGAVPRPLAALLTMGLAFAPALATDADALDPHLVKLLKVYQTLPPPKKATFVDLTLPIAVYLSTVPWQPSPTEVPPEVTDALSLTEAAEVHGRGAGPPARWEKDPDGHVGIAIKGLCFDPA